MKLISICVLATLFVAIQAQDGIFHNENANVVNPAVGTAGNNKSVETAGPYVWKEETGATIREWEKKVGITPPTEQVDVPAPAKHPDIEGTPGMSPAMGPNDAPIKIYLWSDFQCPNCMRAVEPLKYLSRKYPKDVQIIFKQFPIPSHKKAYDCAVATVAAARQGKFWALQDVFFKNIRQLGKDKLEGYAREAGLDIEQYRRDIADPSVAEQIRYELKFADKLGITGTPGFMIAGKKQMGWGSGDGIEQGIKRARNLMTAKKELETCNFEGYGC